MTTNPILTREERILKLTLNRPEKRNALRTEDCLRMVAALNEAELDEGVGAILIEAAGGDFCSGMDLSESLAEDTPERAAVHEELFTVGGRLTKPIVAAVQGRALAGGLGLVTNAHVVVSSENAEFGLVEVRVGLWPFVVFRSVAMAIGERRALELSLTGRLINAQEAHRWSLTHYVVPAAELGERSASIAHQISRLSPEALRRGLDYVHRARGMGQKEAVELAEMMRRLSFRSADFSEGASAFLEKREPAWPSLKEK